ncbi:hypothetical protein HY990_04180 [Candidatus Micrarchaeota archaeon]|nr:hypothetical protein [Candidatus Micrarchaeota archaeon]
MNSIRPDGNKIHARVIDRAAEAARRAVHSAAETARGSKSRFFKVLLALPVALASYVLTPDVTNIKNTGVRSAMGQLLFAPENRSQQESYARDAASAVRTYISTGSTESWNEYQRILAIRVGTSTLGTDPYFRASFLSAFNSSGSTDPHYRSVVDAYDSPATRHIVDQLLRFLSPNSVFDFIDTVRAVRSAVADPDADLVALRNQYPPALVDYLHRERPIEQARIAIDTARRFLLTGDFSYLRTLTNLYSLNHDNLDFTNTFSSEFGSNLTGQNAALLPLLQAVDRYVASRPANEDGTRPVVSAQIRLGWITRVFSAVAGVPFRGGSDPESLSDLRRPADQGGLGNDFVEQVLRFYVESRARVTVSILERLFTHGETDLSTLEQLTSEPFHRERNAEGPYGISVGASGDRTTARQYYDELVARHFNSTFAQNDDARSVVGALDRSYQAIALRQVFIALSSPGTDIAQVTERFGAEMVDFVQRNYAQLLPLFVPTLTRARLNAMDDLVPFAALLRDRFGGSRQSVNPHPSGATTQTPQTPSPNLLPNVSTVYGALLLARHAAVARAPSADALDFVTENHDQLSWFAALDSQTQTNMLTDPSGQLHTTAMSPTQLTRELVRVVAAVRANATSGTDLPAGLSPPLVAYARENIGSLGWVNGEDIPATEQQIMNRVSRNDSTLAPIVHAYQLQQLREHGITPENAAAFAQTYAAAGELLAARDLAIVGVRQSLLANSPPITSVDPGQLVGFVYAHLGDFAQFAVASVDDISATLGSAEARSTAYSLCEATGFSPRLLAQALIDARSNSGIRVPPNVAAFVAANGSNLGWVTTNVDEVEAEIIQRLHGPSPRTPASARPAAESEASALRRLLYLYSPSALTVAMATAYGMVNDSRNLRVATAVIFGSGFYTSVSTRFRPSSEATTVLDHLSDQENELNQRCTRLLDRAGRLLRRFDVLEDTVGSVPGLARMRRLVERQSEELARVRESIRTGLVSAGTSIAAVNTQLNSIEDVLLEPDNVDAAISAAYRFISLVERGVQPDVSGVSGSSTVSPVPTGTSASPNLAFVTPLPNLSLADLMARHDQLANGPHPQQAALFEDIIIAVLRSHHDPTTGQAALYNFVLRAGRSTQARRGDLDVTNVRSVCEVLQRSPPAGANEAAVTQFNLAREHDIGVLEGRFGSDFVNIIRRNLASLEFVTSGASDVPQRFAALATSNSSLYEQLSDAFAQRAPEQRVQISRDRTAAAVSEVLEAFNTQPPRNANAQQRAEFETARQHALSDLRFVYGDRFVAYVESHQQPLENVPSQGLDSCSAQTNAELADLFSNSRENRRLNFWTGFRYVSDRATGVVNSLRSSISLRTASDAQSVARAFANAVAGYRRLFGDDDLLLRQVVNLPAITTTLLDLVNAGTINVDQFPAPIADRLRVARGSPEALAAFSFTAEELVQILREAPFAQMLIDRGNAYFQDLANSDFGDAAYRLTGTERTQASARGVDVSRMDQQAQVLVQVLNTFHGLEMGGLATSIASAYVLGEQASVRSAMFRAIYQVYRLDPRLLDPFLTQALPGLITVSRDAQAFEAGLATLIGAATSYYQMAESGQMNFSNDEMLAHFIDVFRRLHDSASSGVVSGTDQNALLGRILQNSPLHPQEAVGSDADPNAFRLRQPNLSDTVLSGRSNFVPQLTPPLGLLMPQAGANMPTSIGSIPYGGIPVSSGAATGWRNVSRFLDPQHPLIGAPNVPVSARLNQGLAAAQVVPYLARLIGRPPTRYSNVALSHTFNAAAFGNSPGGTRTTGDAGAVSEATSWSAGGGLIYSYLTPTGSLRAQGSFTGSGSGTTRNSPTDPNRVVYDSSTGTYSYDARLTGGGVRVTRGLQIHRLDVTGTGSVATSDLTDQSMPNAPVGSVSGQRTGTNTHTFQQFLRSFVRAGEGDDVLVRVLHRGNTNATDGADLIAVAGGGYTERPVPPDASGRTHGGTTGEVQEELYWVRRNGDIYRISLGQDYATGTVGRDRASFTTLMRNYLYAQTSTLGGRLTAATQFLGSGFASGEPNSAPMAGFNGLAVGAAIPNGSLRDILVAAAAHTPRRTDVPATGTVRTLDPAFLDAAVAGGYTWEDGTGQDRSRMLVVGILRTSSALDVNRTGPTTVTSVGSGGIGGAGIGLEFVIGSYGIPGVNPNNPREHYRPSSWELRTIVSSTPGGFRGGATYRRENRPTDTITEGWGFTGEYATIDVGRRLLDVMSTPDTSHNVDMLLANGYYWRRNAARAQSMYVSLTLLQDLSRAAFGSSDTNGTYATATVALRAMRFGLLGDVQYLPQSLVQLDRAVSDAEARIALLRQNGVTNQEPYNQVYRDLGNYFQQAANGDIQRYSLQLSYDGDTTRVSLLGGYQDQSTLRVTTVGTTTRDRNGGATLLVTSGQPGTTGYTAASAGFRAFTDTSRAPVGSGGLVTTSGLYGEFYGQFAMPNAQWLPVSESVSLQRFERTSVLSEHGSASITSDGITISDLPALASGNMRAVLYGILPSIESPSEVPGDAARRYSVELAQHLLTHSGDRFGPSSRSLYVRRVASGDRYILQFGDIEDLRIWQNQHFSVGDGFVSRVDFASTQVDDHGHERNEPSLRFSGADGVSLFRGFSLYGSLQVPFDSTGAPYEAGRNISVGAALSLYNSPNIQYILSGFIRRGQFGTEQRDVGQITLSRRLQEQSTSEGRVDRYLYIYYQHTQRGVSTLVAGTEEDFNEYVRNTGGVGYSYVRTRFSDNRTITLDFFTEAGAETARSPPDSMGLTTNYRSDQFVGRLGLNFSLLQGTGSGRVSGWNIGAFVGYGSVFYPRTGVGTDPIQLASPTNISPTSTAVPWSLGLSVGYQW